MIRKAELNNLPILVQENAAFLAYDEKRNRLCPVPASPRLF